MADNEKTVWRIHTGRTGDADNLFFKKNHIAIGWTKMGDLSLTKNYLQLKMF